VEVLRVIVRGKFSVGYNFPEDISVGRGIFSRKWSEISWLNLEFDKKLKKTNKKKTSFSTESKEQY